MLSRLTKMGKCHVSHWDACGCGHMVLGLRFSAITLVLLTMAIVIIFATSVLGGSRNVGDACFYPNQLYRWLPACSTSSRASRDTLQPHANALFLTRPIALTAKNKAAHEGHLRLVTA